MSTWRVFSKLTLSLRVLGLRTDGFHELHAFTVSVSEPHDELTVEVLEHRSERDRNSESNVELELSGRATEGVTSNDDNLAVRAAHALLATLDDERCALRVRLVLRKGIPAGAGLGGGSADAAAVLVALDRMLEVGASTEALAALGATLGSDVPFCLRGGAAYMEGRGELLGRAPVPRLHVLVVVPPFAIATPAVYRAWDELGGPVLTRVVPGPPGVADFVNDLETAAERVEPRLADFRARLERTVGTPAILAGSGSACAVVYDDESAAAAAQQRVQAAGFASTCCVGVTREGGVEEI